MQQQVFSEHICCVYLSLALLVFVLFEDKLRQERASIPIVADNLQVFERRLEYWLSGMIESS